MQRILRVIFVLLYIPIFLVGFGVVHELGHTVVARLSGDPNSYFTLYRSDENSTCLGCNVYDPDRLTRNENMLVSLAGLLATQMVAWALLLVSGIVAEHPFWERLLRRSALAFAFLDVIVQVVQGLLYDLGQQTFPTNVDLVDFMLLTSQATGAGQALMKTALWVLGSIYLAAFLLVYRRVLSRQEAAA
jgi:hypothetical protein